MGQWGRQHEQFSCCFLETVSVHPTWSTQSSGRSRHHSSERRKSIRNAINTGVGAPMEAPPTDATIVGLAVSVLAVPTAMALKRRGVVRFVCHGPHRGRATHPHPKTVCLKTCCLGCSNLGRTDLLNLHYLVLPHLLSRRCGFLRGPSPISASLFAALALSSSAASGSCGGPTGAVDSSSGPVLIGCCNTRKTRDTCNPPPEASRGAPKRTRVERAERGEHGPRIQRHTRRLRANPLERIVLMCNAHLCTFRVQGSRLRPRLRPALLLPGRWRWWWRRSPRQWRWWE